MAEPIQDYIAKHMFDAGGLTGTTYYYRITARDQTRSFHYATKTMVEYDSLAWVDGCITLTEEEVALAAKTGVFRVIMFKEIPGGVYNITVHKQAGAGPVPADDLVEHWQQKHGSIFGF